MPADYEILISETQLKQRIAELGQELGAFYQDKLTSESPLLIVGVLKGCFVFLADLVRAIDMPCEIQFVQASSYGASTTSSGKPKLNSLVSSSLRDRHVLIVEDIVDTGLTMDAMLKSFSAEGAKSVSVCSLLHKPSRSEVEVPIKFKGFEIEDKFVIGYGLDFDERFRELNEIVIYKPDAN